MIRGIMDFFRSLNFRILDWLVSGQLTERNELAAEVEHLRVQLAGCSVAANGGDLELPSAAWGWSPAFGEIVRLWKYTHNRIEQLEYDNQRLRGYKDQQQRIFDLEFRLKSYQHIEKRLHTKQRAKTEGFSGAAMGLIATSSKENENKTGNC